MSKEKSPRAKQKRNLKNEIDEFENIMRDDKKNLGNIQIKNHIKFKNKKQKELYNKILENRIIFVKGCAGTGKTLITLMAALECVSNAKYKIGKIILSKPIVEASKSIGFLPGDLNEKVYNYFFSFHDNLKKIVGEYHAKNLKDTGVVKESILNFMRGNTFGTLDKDGNPVGAICILDECQNASYKDLKLFISRLGEGTKLIIMGDTDQTDLKLKYGEKTSLDDAFDRFKGIKGVEFVEFTEDEIVRDPFLIEVMKRYKV